MPEASLQWKIDCLKLIQQMPSNAGFMAGQASKQDLIWVQDLARDGYISAKFRMGYHEEGQNFADSTVPNMIWDLHVLEKGKRLIAEYENARPQQSQMNQSLPPAMEGLMQEAVRNLLPVYHQSKRVALNEHVANMSRRGLRNSSAYDQGELRIYIEEFEAHAQRVLDAIKSVHFTPFEGCENELTKIAATELRNLGNSEFYALLAQQPKQPKKASFAHYNARVNLTIRHIETQLKIHVTQLRAKIPIAPTQQVTVVGNNNSVQTGGGNKISTQIPKPDKPHWTTTPTFLFTVGIFIAAVVAIPFVSDWIHSKPKNLTGEDGIKMQSEDKNPPKQSLWKWNAFNEHTEPFSVQSRASDWQSNATVLGVGETAFVSVINTPTNAAWQINASKGYCGPAGYTNDIASTKYPFPNAPEGCLVMEFGNGKYTYWTNSSEVKVVNIPGPLFFMANDDWTPDSGAFDDNLGAIRLSITVSNGTR